MNPTSHAKRKRRSPAPRAPEEALAVGYLMGRARASLLASLDVQLTPYEVSGVQFAVLKNLADGNAHTAAELCRLMHHDTGSMTRLLDQLEQRQLVRRERSRTDRRQLFLRLAPAGRAQLPRLMGLAAQVLERHLAGFSRADIGALKTYLGRMIDNGQTAGDNTRSHTGTPA